MILARFISFAANPIFIFIGLPFFLVYRTTGDFEEAWKWTWYTWAFLLLFVGFVLYGVRNKIFSDVDVSRREQRPVLYFTGAILSVLYLAGLIILNGPLILIVTIIGFIVGIIIGSLVNMKIKASVHVAAVSALLTLLSIINRGYYVLLLLAIPLVCWARVKIKRHSVSEVITGGFLGSFLSFVMYFVVKSYIDL
jgi:membrane-associated phospholipid phosphatase